MTTLLKKPAIFAAAFAAAMVLMFGVLCAAPAAAVADDGSLAAADGAALTTQQDLSTQASTESIPVITKIVIKGSRGSTIAVKYNSNGQISAYSNRVYSFNKKGGMTSSTWKDYAGDTSTFDYTLDKKGRVKEIDGSALNYAIYPKYNAAGYVAKEVAGPYVDAYTWDDNGLLQKTVTKGSSSKLTYTYTYDSNDNLATARYKRQEFEFKNTYDGDLLKKRVETDDQGEVRSTTTYTYKTIKVPKAFAAQVKAQQKWLKYQGTTFNEFPRLESMYL